MQTQVYVKLSRIRDYGIGERPNGLSIEELDKFTKEQLSNLRDIFQEEVDDIDYQLNREAKHYEHDLKWHYGAKSSKKARQAFIDRICEILGNKTCSKDELSVNTNLQILSSSLGAIVDALRKDYPAVFDKIMETVLKDQERGFSAKDME